MDEPVFVFSLQYSCQTVKKNRLVRDYLGLALIPQAGVAIGLAALGARTLGGAMGIDLQTLILASSVLYELIAPGCAKLALYLSRSYSTKLEDVAVVEEVTETGEKKTDVQLLIERIRKIQSELPVLESGMSEEEPAFTEAAGEQLALSMLLSAIIVTAAISGNSILFSSKKQIKGRTTSVGLWCCAVVGLALGIRIDDMESNPAYLNSWFRVFTVSFTVDSAELKQLQKARRDH